MTKKFKNIVLVGRTQTKKIAGTLLHVAKFLKEEGANVLMEKETSFIIHNNSYPTICRNDLKNNCDLLVVVGGDGSLLFSSHFAVDQNIPIVGINRGKLGFLTDIKPKEINNLKKILHGNYKEEKRFLLNATIKNINNDLLTGLALNDIVFLSGEINRMIEFTVHVNKKYLCTYRADGIIISTPTGSTAHALSGGGAIIHPKLDAIILLPMFSHNLSSRPIVIDSKDIIEIALSNNCKACTSVSCSDYVLYIFQITIILKLYVIN